MCENGPYHATRRAAYGVSGHARSYRWDGPDGAEREDRSCPASGSGPEIGRIRAIGAEAGTGPRSPWGPTQRPWKSGRRGEETAVRWQHNDPPGA